MRCLVLRLLADENFKGEITRGLLRRKPDLDLVRVQDAGLSGADDPEILAWAAQRGRILLTHDLATIPDFAYERVAGGESMPGVFVVPRRLSVRQVIEDVLFLAAETTPKEWAGVVVYLPL
jgi:predicted nuclease of predicted toxin-antitoxin system